MFSARVLATPAVLPRFWIFMYRVSPLTYLVSAMLSTGVANTELTCSSIELAVFNPPIGQTCGEYMNNYITSFGGAVYNSNATSGCKFCSATSTNAFLNSVFVHYSDRWRNFGLIWVYILANIFGFILFYWLGRVPKGGKKHKKE
jgi:ATP-binding cassette subfamily G (WHITE) protein 2 (PDR)